MKLHHSALALAATWAIGSAAQAALISSQGDPTPNSSTVVDDGVISPGEYSAAYTGGGTGFGGTLGLGTVYMETDGTNLYVAIAPGADVNDNFVIHLDTKSGGFTDAAMSDAGDPGRRLLSDLTRDVDDPWPLLPDYGIVMGGFGQVSFELTSGSHNFIAFEGDQTGNSSTLAREFEISLAAMGNPSVIDFFVNYGSNDNFMSNESVPVEAYNALNNPGHDNSSNGGGPLTHANYNQFQVPEPASIGLLALSAVGLMRRRRTC